MSKEKRLNIVMIVFTCLIVLGYTMGVYAAGYTPLSKGAIKFDNGTTTTADDVIFDPADMTKLYERCK